MNDKQRRKIINDSINIISKLKVTWTYIDTNGNHYLYKKGSNQISKSPKYKSSLKNKVQVSLKNIHNNYSKTEFIDRKKSATKKLKDIIDSNLNNVNYTEAWVNNKLVGICLEWQNKTVVYGDMGNY